MEEEKYKMTDRQKLRIRKSAQTCRQRPQID